MISSKALLAGGRWESWYLETEPVPEKTVFQLWGTDIGEIVRAAETFRTLPIRGVDINMGCSAPLIRTRGGGIAWMNDPEKAARLIRELRRRMGDKTVSAKIRIGMQEDGDAMVRFVRRLADEGLDWITINPQTGRESRSRPGRWSYVAQLQSENFVPVVGSGNIVDVASFQRRRDLSGIHSFMIGRAAISRPWLFSFLRKWEKDSNTTMVVDLEETAYRALEWICRWQPKEFHLSRIRRFLVYWSRNLQFGNRVAARISRSTSAEQMAEAVGDYFHRNQEEREWTEQE